MGSTSARAHFDRGRNFVGHHFWARRYFVSTVGRDEEAIRKYFKHQEIEDPRQEKLRIKCATFRWRGGRREAAAPCRPGRLTD